TFSGRAQVSDGTNTEFASPAIGPNGQIYVAFLDFSGHAIKIDVSTTFSGTAGSFNFSADHLVQALVESHFITFPPPQAHHGIEVIPSLAVDRGTSPNRGRLYIAYNDLPNLSDPDNFDIYETVSLDGGNTWTARTRVNNDVGPTT